MNFLSRLWIQPTPAPATFAEYVARLAADSPGFFDLYDAAKARYAELCRMGAECASILNPYDFDVAALAGRAMSSLKRDDALALAVAIGENAKRHAVREQAFPWARALHDPNQCAAVALEREFPKLRQELTAKLVEPAQTRIRAELERVRPLEEARQREAAEDEARACGLNPEHAELPERESALVRQFESFDQELSRLVERMKNPSKDSVAGGNYQFWFPYATDTIEKMRVHFNSAAVETSEPAGELRTA